MRWFSLAHKAPKVLAVINYANYGFQVIFMIFFVTSWRQDHSQFTVEEAFNQNVWLPVIILSFFLFPINTPKPSFQISVLHTHLFRMTCSQHIVCATMIGSSGEFHCYLLQSYCVSVRPWVKTRSVCSRDFTSTREDGQKADKPRGKY